MSSFSVYHSLLIPQHKSGVMLSHGGPKHISVIQWFLIVVRASLCNTYFHVFEFSIITQNLFISMNHKPVFPPAPTP